MNVMQISSQIPDYAKDIRLNLKILTEDQGAPGLSQSQKQIILLASSYAAGNSALTNSLEKEFSGTLDAAMLYAAKAANSIMAMNNIYYRFVHALEDPAWLSKPAQLRMNVLAKPGIDKVSFELMCLAVSMINGCSLCMKSHTAVLLQHGLSEDGIQSTARIAAVVHAAAASLKIIETST